VLKRRNEKMCVGSRKVAEKEARGSTKYKKIKNHLKKIEEGT
jgi:hypothetical protein